MGFAGNQVRPPPVSWRDSEAGGGEARSAAARGGRRCGPGADGRQLRGRRGLRQTDCNLMGRVVTVQWLGTPVRKPQTWFLRRVVRREPEVTEERLTVPRGQGACPLPLPRAGGEGRKSSAGLVGWTPNQPRVLGGRLPQENRVLRGSGGLVLPQDAVAPGFGRPGPQRWTRASEGGAGCTDGRWSAEVCATLRGTCAGRPERLHRVPFCFVLTLPLPLEAVSEQSRRARQTRATVGVGPGRGTCQRLSVPATVCVCSASGNSRGTRPPSDENRPLQHVGCRGHQSQAGGPTQLRPCPSRSACESGPRQQPQRQPRVVSNPCLPRPTAALPSQRERCRCSPAEKNPAFRPQSAEECEQPCLRSRESHRPVPQRDARVRGPSRRDGGDRVRGGRSGPQRREPHLPGLQPRRGQWVSPRVCVPWWCSECQPVSLGPRGAGAVLWVGRGPCASVWRGRERRAANEAA